MWNETMHRWLPLLVLFHVLPNCRGFHTGAAPQPVSKAGLFMGNCTETQPGTTENKQKVNSNNGTSETSDSKELNKMAAEGKDELVYFNLKGRAEIIRILYTYGGIDFKETRIDYGSEEWINMKPNVTFGTLPLMIRGNVRLNQNIAIARLLAREQGLVGDTPIEQAQEDCIIDKLEELGNKGADILIFEPDPERKKVDGKKFMEETLPTGLATLEKALSENPNKSGFFVGKRVKWCDIYFFCVAERFTPSVPNLLQPYPGLNTLFNTVKDLPGVARWLDIRPKEW